MRKPKNPETYVEATAQFLAATDWIGPEHAPAVISLRLVAAQLDEAMTAPLVAQYNLTYRALLKSRPVDPGADDPLEQALRKVEQ